MLPVSGAEQLKVSGAHTDLPITCITIIIIDSAATRIAGDVETFKVSERIESAILLASLRLALHSLPQQQATLGSKPQQDRAYNQTPLSCTKLLQPKSQPDAIVSTRRNTRKHTPTSQQCAYSKLVSPAPHSGESRGRSSVREILSPISFGTHRFHSPWARAVRLSSSCSGWIVQRTSERACSSRAGSAG